MTLWLILSVAFAQLQNPDILSPRLEEKPGPTQEFRKGQREQYILEGLLAFLESSPDKIWNTYNYLSVMRKNICFSAVKQLEVQCLIETSKDSCSTVRKNEKQLCNRIADFVITTLLEEPRIVSRSLKSRLAKSTKGNMRDAVAEEIKRHYAVVLLDLLASEEWACRPKDLKCMAKSIHTFCERYSDNRKGSWQGCSGGLVWYIGSRLAESKEVKEK